MYRADLCQQRRVIVAALAVTFVVQRHRHNPIYAHGESAIRLNKQHAERLSEAGIAIVFKGVDEGSERFAVGAHGSYAAEFGRRELAGQTYTSR